MIPYKTPSGKLIARSPNGEFRQWRLSEFVDGVNEDADLMTCTLCGYGTKKPWRPVMLSGYCPECRGQKNEKLIIPITQEITDIIDEIEKTKLQYHNGPFINPAKFRELSPVIARLQSKVNNLLNNAKKDYFNQFKHNNNNVNFQR